MTAALTARPATLADAPAVAEIYNEGMENRGAAFETTPRSAHVARLLEPNLR